MRMEIKEESDIICYIQMFKSLNQSDIKKELDDWEKLIENDSYNKYEFLTFMKILDIMEYNQTSNDTKTIDVLNNTIDELRFLTDYTLDGYQGTKGQISLLDNINKSLVECEMLYKYYNEKIVN